jgi:hypothetical protein
MQIIKVRLADGRTVSPSDWTSSPLWSSVEISDAASLQPLPAFSYGPGGSVPGSFGPRQATDIDTNMQGEGGVLMDNEELMLFGLQIDLFQLYDSLSLYFTGGERWSPTPPHISATNVQRVLRSTLVKMRIATTKTYITMGLGFFPAAQGVHATLGAALNLGAGTTGNTLAPFIGANGNVSVGSGREFATPYSVNPSEQFSVSLEFPFGAVVEPLASGSAGSALDFGDDTGARILARVYTIGPRRRPVA